MGVGRTKNNPLSIKCRGGSYCHYETLAEGYSVATALWNRSYASLPLDDALARWKTGNPANRDPATIRYIANIRKEL